jgi:hypothetical protein
MSRHLGAKIGNSQIEDLIQENEAYRSNDATDNPEDPNYPLRSMHIFLDRVELRLVDLAALAQMFNGAFDASD